MPPIGTVGSIVPEISAVLGTARTVENGLRNPKEAIGGVVSHQLTQGVENTIGIG